MFANIDTLIEFHPVTIGVIIAAALAAIISFCQRLRDSFLQPFTKRH